MEFGIHVVVEVSATNVHELGFLTAIDTDSS